MNSLPVFTALATGFMASGHCIGMCGPMTALGASRPGQPRVQRAATYNAGRLASYALFGALFGALGHLLGSAASIAQWGLIIRVALGGVLLLIGLRLLLQRKGASVFERLGARLWRRLQPLTRQLNPADRTRDLFALGLLWGWLPCGMVYSMLAIAAVSGSASTGAATMLAFGVGTLPAMLGMSVASGGLRQLRRPGAQRLLGAALVISGLWMAALPIYHALPFNHDPANAHRHSHSQH